MLCEIGGERYLLASEPGLYGLDVWTKSARREKDWCTATHKNTPLSSDLQREIGRYVSEALTFCSIEHKLDIDI